MIPWKSLRAWALIAGATAGSEVIAQTDLTLQFSVAGQSRHSLVYVPEGIENPPVVFFIHGANGSGANFRNETKADAVADAGKFIAVYPSASENGGTGTWEDMRGTGNFPFFLALIDSLDTRYSIDRSRIYMTGFSQGGFISFVAACRYWDVFAAVAPVSGHAGEPCNLGRSVPVYMTFGANEEPTPSFVDDFDLWREFNGCAGEPSEPALYPDSDGDSKVRRVTSGECEDGAIVVLDSIIGQGHQWPGASTRNQAEEVWDFFEPQVLEVPTGLREIAGTLHAAVSSWGQAGRRLRWLGAAPLDGAFLTDVGGRKTEVSVFQGRELSLEGLRAGFFVLSAQTREGVTRTPLLLP